jgi:TRAP-type C4-dicarboxylate transport system permease small subunit
MSLSRFEQALVTANRAIIFIMMAIMATLVFTNVITRYVFNFSIIWAEEVSQYLMIWIAYLGAGLALRQGRHVAIEIFQDRLRAPLGRALRAAIAGMILVFLAVLTVLGFQFVAFAWIQETPVLNISLGIPYLAVPIGAMLFVLHLCFVFRGYVQKQFEPVHALDELAETQG